jgi:hypothetical protein
MSADPAPLLEGFHDAIEEEVLAIQDDLARRGIDRPLSAGGGHEADSDAAGFVYDWSLSPGRYVIRTDDAVRVSCEAGETRGFVTSFDPTTRSVRVAVHEWLGRHPGVAELTFDPTWLLSALSARLRNVEAEPEAYHVPTALRLFGRAYPETGTRAPDVDHRDGLNDSQCEALERILGSRTQLVWGPPGTGKTRLLAHAGCALGAEGPVLVLAITNAAVDEAARRIAARLGTDAVRDGGIVRVGAELSATGDPDLSLEAGIERSESRGPSRLTRLLEELEGELGTPRSAPDAPDLRSRIARVAARARADASPGVLTRVGHVALAYQRAATRVLSAADLVLTTFARLTLRDDLWNLRFRSLLVDESSSAPLPYLFVGACLASERVVVCGDFQQLPAVVLSSGEVAGRWMRRDIFQEAGVIDPAAGRDLPDPRDTLCSMLRRQYRMAPAIRGIVSDLFYGGRLEDAAVVSKRGTAFPPLVLADTAGLSPRVERAEGSRGNEVHVEVVLQILELLGRSGVADVGVVTPYRLQARRIAQQVRRRLGRAAPRGLEVATIHRFQGREKTAIIVDTVDAPPGGSWFLNEVRNPDFPRLLNVALSRSREGLILVGTSDGLRHTLPSDALLVRVLDRVRDTGRVLDARHLAASADELGWT